MKGRLLRFAGTTALAAAVVLRAVRTIGNLESVLAFYNFGAGPLWALLALALLFGPYLTALAAAYALWLPWDRAGRLGAAGFCAAAFFVFSEGLTVFARAINGHGAYVGAEPLLSALVCGISAITILAAHRAGGGIHN